MKAPLSTLLLTAAVSAAVYAAPADATGSTSTIPNEPQAQAPESGCVPSALTRLHFLQGKPDLGAKYYIYIQSASWCGPCRKYMPIIVDQYARMKQAGIEMILVGRDSTPKAVLEYAQGYNVPFPVIPGAECNADNLPGFVSARGIPHIRIVNRDGAVMLDGHPHHFFSGGNWKAMLEEWAGADAGSINPDMDDENGQYDIVVRHAEDMDDMLRAMGRHMRTNQKFQSRIPLPGPLVWEAPSADDIMAGFTLTGGDGTFTLSPAYLDSWRMLHAFRTNATAGGASSKLGGWGVKLTAEEFKALSELKKRLERIVRPGMSESAIVLAIHDDLVNRATFKNGGDPSAAGLILNNQGGCDAYARYMYLALNIAGIECHRVVGTEDFHHSWNLVSIDKKWYHVDAAWDDPSCTKAGQPQAILSHAFCCVSDTDMAKTHKWNRSIYPSADTTMDFSFRRNAGTAAVLHSNMKTAYRTGAATLEVKLGFKDSSYVATSATPVDFYAITDKDAGNVVIYFDRAESGAHPVELQVEAKPTESAGQAALWQHIKR